VALVDYNPPTIEVPGPSCIREWFEMKAGVEPARLIFAMVQGWTLEEIQQEEIRKWTAGGSERHLFSLGLTLMGSYPCPYTGIFYHTCNIGMNEPDGHVLYHRRFFYDESEAADYCMFDHQRYRIKKFQKEFHQGLDEGCDRRAKHEFKRNVQEKEAVRRNIEKNNKLAIELLARNFSAVNLNNTKPAALDLEPDSSKENIIVSIDAISCSMVHPQKKKASYYSFKM